MEQITSLIVKVEKDFTTVEINGSSNEVMKMIVIALSSHMKSQGINPKKGLEYIIHETLEHMDDKFEVEEIKVN